MGNTINNEELEWNCVCVCGGIDAERRGNNGKGSGIDCGPHCVCCEKNFLMPPKEFENFLCKGRLVSNEI